jgi:hypothetical protein
MSYREYLDRILPRDNPDNEIQRNTKLINFSRPGNPGAKFKGPFEKMMKAIALPKGVKEELNILDDNVGDNYVLQNQPTVAYKADNEVSNSPLSEEEEARLTKQLLGEGKYHLLPSFFRTLIFLKKMKKEFSVVFRNYNAQDLQNVIAEFNLFCKGEHPCYSGRSGTSLVKFDGSKGTKEMRFKDKHQRAFYFREGEHREINRLVTGAPKRPPTKESADDFYQGQVEEGAVNMFKEITD